MFSSQESTPWYRSTTVLIAISILLPPVGIALIWLQPRTVKSKVIGSLCVVVLVAFYFAGYRALTRSRNESVYAAVEAHRAQQQREAQAQAGNAQVQSAPTSPQTAQPSTTNPAGSSEVVSSHVTRNYWTNFRGPNRDGKYDEMQVLTSWPAQGLPLVWKEPAGVGYASFSIADGRAYTIEQRRGKEVVAAYDVNTGRELWIQSWSAEYTDETGDGPRTTPTWDDGWLYALGATGELRCINAKTGAVRWGKNILSDNQAQNLPWAMAASPLIVDDKVIVLPGGTAGKSVVAYNKVTGAPVWKVQGDRQAYVSPMLVTLAGRRQVLVVSSSRVYGLAPEDGALLWSQSWDTDNGINVSQPLIVDNNRFFISSGYGKGAALIEVTGSANSFKAQALWTNINMKNKFNSSVLHEGHVYGLDEGILTCIDVNTGDRKWKGGRYGYGQVLLASGHLIVMSDAGELALVKASPNEYKEVARFTALDGKTWNYPAIAGGRLFVRNAKEMAVYKVAAE